MNKSSQDFSNMLRKAVEATVVKRPVIRRKQKPVKDAIYGVAEPKKTVQKKVLPKKNHGCGIATDMEQEPSRNEKPDRNSTGFNATLCNTTAITASTGCAIWKKQGADTGNTQYRTANGIKSNVESEVNAIATAQG